MSTPTNRLPVRPGAAPAAPAKAPVAPVARPLPSNEVIRLFEKVPQHKGVLSGEKGKANLRLTEQQRQICVILDLGNSGVCLLVTDGSRAHPTVFEVKEKINRLGLKITEHSVDPGILRQLYERDAGLGTQQNNQDAATSTVIQDFDRLIDKYITENISDIHIEVRGDKAKVRVRRNGFLVDTVDWSRSYAVELCTAVYNAFTDAGSASTSFNWKQQQQASVTRGVKNGLTKIRFQSVPAYPDESFDCVLRLQALDANHGFTSLEELGYEKSHLHMLELMMAKPVGAIFIAGTTGSGKSTTIKNMLANIFRERDGIKMYTVEDPPEFLMPFATQIPVARGSTADNPFMEAMKACMRADPDVMMVGEIRDLNTAALAVQMVESGHQMLTTVHADSAIGIVKRLEDIGVPTHTLSYPNFLSGLIYQRLVPVLCEQCKTPFVPKDQKESATLARIRIAIGKDATDNAKFFTRGPGCEKCDQQGIKGRSACAEMVIPDRKMREMFSENRYEECWAYWRGRGKEAKGTNMAGKTALEHATIKMLRGIVSPIDLEKEFGMITQDSEDGAWDAATMLGLNDVEGATA